ncbi:hypothetical protein GCM10027425_20300 [Alteromonas gracilis]
MPTGPVGTSSSVQRRTALDGLRGITIVLVVLGHTSLIWPQNPVYDVPGLAGLFRGGSVTVFFVVGGYVVTAGLLRWRDAGRLDALTFYLRRIVRLWAQLVPLCAALLAVSLWDASDPNGAAANTRTFVSALTFTLNDAYMDDVLGVRNDLGHLWYLAVVQQVYLVLPLALVLLGGRRRIAAAIAAVGVVGSAAWRLVLDAQQGWYVAGLDTLARMDGPLLGVLLALLVHRPGGDGAPLLALGRRTAARMLMVGLVAWAALLAVSAEITVPLHVSWWGEASLIMAAVVTLGVIAGEPGDRLQRALSHDVLTWLGRASLVIYLWHFPLIFWLGRHLDASEWVAFSGVLGGLVLIIAWAGDRWIEEPTRIWLRTHLQPGGPR